jgi:hypothetical protein
MRRSLLTSLTIGLVGLAGVLAGCGSSQAGETVTIAGGTTTVTETATQAAPAETVTVTKPPPSPGVEVSYGEWEGLFNIHGARLVSRYGTPSVLGQFEYLGGGDCDLDYVEVSGTFFDKKNRIVSSGLWNSDTVPEACASRWRSLRQTRFQRVERRSLSPARRANEDMLMPTAPDNGQRSPRSLLAQVVRRLFRSENADDNEEREDKPDPERDAHQNGD